MGDNQKNMITQFKGESRKDAIINHFSLDIEEQQNFFSFIREMGYALDSEDYMIESLHKMWRDKNP